VVCVGGQRRLAVAAHEARRGLHGLEWQLACTRCRAAWLCGLYHKRTSRTVLCLPPRQM
jgi:hypothetical protein